MSTKKFILDFFVLKGFEMSNIKEIFSKRLKEARLNIGYTQTELAEKLQTTQGAYQKWESGAREPNVETIFELSLILDVTVDYLLGRTTSRSHFIDPASEDEATLTEVALLEITDLLTGINKEAIETGQNIEEIINALALPEQTKKLYADFLNFAKFQYFGNILETTQSE